ncbi:MAG TPA: hypothetical protein VHM89_01100 [Acidimicrobiales bacterium]|nr:hypothetical protein [Acidimicrobiales bacterium]
MSKVRAVFLAAMVVAALVVAVAPGAGADTRFVGMSASPQGDGYWMVRADGDVVANGAAPFLGSLAGRRLNKPVVGMESTPSGRGYWLVASDGGLFAFGDARFFGSTGAIRLNRPIVGMAVTPTGLGYWLVASDGGIFAFGDARFYGSTGAIALNRPVVGMAATPAGDGYWLVASDGGIFAFGAASFHGSLGAIRLNQPVVAIDRTPTGHGYWMTASDGGLFAFGDATAKGSAAGFGLVAPIVGLQATPDGLGYWLAAADGGVFSFGRASFLGAPTQDTPAAAPAPGPAPAPSGPTAPSGSVLDRPFAPTAAWNAVIADAPVLDPNSAAIGGYFGANRAFADLYEFGVPIFDADSSTPRFDVQCTKPWGTCQLSRQSVPIPSNAVPSPGSDGAMVVVDWQARTAYEFWQAVRLPAGGWTTSWGGVVSVDGSGTPGSAVGAGVSRLAGVVRTAEIAQGRIDHALVFSTNNACRTTFRFPASKTDASSTRADCIPEGARIQLDPSIDVATLPGITAGERAVARALQVYGAYAIDVGGAAMAFIFENPAGEPDPYGAAGLARDYFDMAHVPWGRLRVLRQWDGH